MISSSTAAEVARGVSRLLIQEGYSPILEFTLPNGRRLMWGPGSRRRNAGSGNQGGPGRSAGRCQGRTIWIIAICSISPSCRISRPSMCRTRPA